MVTVKTKKKMVANENYISVCANNMEYYISRSFKRDIIRECNSVNVPSVCLYNTISNFIF